jgi:CBS-domain-containing membrane protein
VLDKSGGGDVHVGGPIDIEAGKLSSSTEESSLEGKSTTGSATYQPLEVNSVDNSSVVPSGKGGASQWRLLLAAQLTLTVAYLHKWLGGKVNMPVRIDLRLSLVAFVGCFVTISCWQVMTDGINQIFVPHGVVNPMSLPGSFGALCTIIFALPTVPLAQPRIVLLAHTWAMTVATALLYIFDRFHYIWLQKALALAITVSGMAKFGILNPPAGAVSLAMLTYANSSAYSIHGWLYLIVSTYLGCCICIVVGVVWHNLFTGRTYPLFW